MDGGALAASSTVFTAGSLSKATVTYRGYVLSREDLVSMRSILIEKILETMKKSSYFKAIMPLKLFTDMYQFYQQSQN
jgi:hypothetical protein